MIDCLQLYLNKGLIKSKFVNLKVRQLSAETCHDFIEWCGLIEGSSANRTLAEGGRLSKQTLYEEFVQEYPDYAPRAKRSISNIAFNKWLKEYGEFRKGVTFKSDRDHNGRWVMYSTSSSKLKEKKDEFEF